MSQLFFLRFSTFVPIDTIITELSNYDEVMYTHQPIQTANLSDPDDEYFQEGSSGSQWNLYKINAHYAWNISTGSSSKVIAIIESAGPWDSGVPDRNHEDFFKNGVSKFVPGLGNYLTVPGNHATGVAGIIGAATDNNETGIASLGWNLMMIPYRYTNYEDDPDNENSLLNRINTAIADSVDVINCSFVTINSQQGGQLGDTMSYPLGPCVIYGSYDYQSVRDAISNAISQGIVVVAGTGNTGWEITNQVSDCEEILPRHYIPYPAAYTSVIGVSATDSDDNFGANPSSGKSYNYEYPGDPYFIDISAPGVNVFTTQNYNNYSFKNGTSFSSPHGAALSGLILSVNNSLTTSQVQECMTETAVDLGQTGRDRKFGHGRIDAYKALKYTIENYGGVLKNNLYIPSYETWNIASDVTLTFQNGANLQITGAMNIDQNATLNFDGGYINVTGELNAEGTAGNMITFDFGSISSSPTNGIKFQDGSEGYP
jgi:hypothetical protein